MSREDRVAAFIAAAKPVTFEVAWTCFEEECLEMAEAAMAYAENKTEETRANLVKEWADVQYTLSQLAVFYEIPGDAAFNRVADNNMTKVVNGKVFYREDGKVLKPDNYVKPDMTGL